ncbi:hypothetical protein, partial [uncultured Dubosiella sp.]|uniref:hypothetical protein n=1 Tax=uncultured Dubosiella sp. TaxID=1937011 RepID=UPI00272DD40E
RKPGSFQPKNSESGQRFQFPVLFRPITCFFRGLSSPLSHIATKTTAYSFRDFYGFHVAAGGLFRAIRR